jgi:hypothetical protein
MSSRLEGRKHKEARPQRRYRALDIPRPVQDPAPPPGALAQQLGRGYSTRVRTHGGGPHAHAMYRYGSNQRLTRYRPHLASGRTMVIQVHWANLHQTQPAAKTFNKGRPQPSAWRYKEHITAHRRTDTYARRHRQSRVAAGCATRPAGRAAPATSAAAAARDEPAGRRPRHLAPGKGGGGAHSACTCTTHHGAPCPASLAKRSLPVTITDNRPTNPGGGTRTPARLQDTAAPAQQLNPQAPGPPQ